MNNEMKNVEAGSESGIKSDFSKDMGYGDYLKLDELLSLQNPKSDHHDEELFIIIHQASELWMKLIIHEMKGAINDIIQDKLGAAFKKFSRITRIQLQLIQSWDVLTTLTPSDYLGFRDKLGSASGFQSFQNRLIEFSMGYKSEKVLPVFEHKKDLYETMQEALNTPSVYDVSIELLAKRGLPIDQEVLDRAKNKNYEEHPSVEKAWSIVYQDTEKYWDLYELAEKLVDIEGRQQQWRLNHMFTVERIVGNKIGTGGSSGVAYLKRVLDHRFFPELWKLRTNL